MKRAWPIGLLALLLIGCVDDPPPLQPALDSDQETDIWHAAALGRLETLEIALADGVDLNTLNQDGWGPLHLAVVVRQLATLEWLLNNGARINAETAGARSALDIALTPGYMENESERTAREEIAEFLRQHGAQRGSACCGSNIE